MSAAGENTNTMNVELHGKGPVKAEAPSADDEAVAAHQVWLEAREAENFEVIVSDAQGSRANSFGRKVVTYLVSVDALHTAVRRRYSDFEWLQQVLRQKVRCAGMKDGIV